MLPRTPRGRAGTSGFSIAELLAVLILLGVLGALAAPAFNRTTASMATRGAIAQVAADIRYTRMLAVREGKRAVFDIVDSTQYRLVVDPDGLNRVVKRVKLTDEYPGLVITYNANQLWFNSRGIVSGDGLRKVKAVRGGMSDSVTISALGQPHGGN